MYMYLALSKQAQANVVPMSSMLQITTSNKVYEYISIVSAIFSSAVFEENIEILS